MFRYFVRCFAVSFRCFVSLFRIISLFRSLFRGLVMASSTCCHFKTKTSPWHWIWLKLSEQCQWRDTNMKKSSKRYRLSIITFIHTNYVAKLELFVGRFKVKNYAVYTDYWTSFNVYYSIPTFQPRPQGLLKKEAKGSEGPGKGWSRDAYTILNISEYLTFQTGGAGRFWFLLLNMAVQRRDRSFCDWNYDDDKLFNWQWE